MPADEPWGGMNPNSAHQQWSRWTITVEDRNASRSKQEILSNARTYFRMLFRSSVGRIRVDRRSTFAYRFVGWRIVIEIEGPPAQDPAYRKAAATDILTQFVEKGFRHRRARVDVALLAGQTEDGRPPSQLLVIPPIPVS